MVHPDQGHGPATFSDSAPGLLTFTYTGNHITSITDFTGRTWLYGYDSAGRLVSVTAPITSTAPLTLVQYGYYSDASSTTCWNPSPIRTAT